MSYLSCLISEKFFPEYGALFVSLLEAERRSFCLNAGVFKSLSTLALKAEMQKRMEDDETLRVLFEILFGGELGKGCWNHAWIRVDLQLCFFFSENFDIFEACERIWGEPITKLFPNGEKGGKLMFKVTRLESLVAEVISFKKVKNDPLLMLEIISRFMCPSEHKRFAMYTYRDRCQVELNGTTVVDVAHEYGDNCTYWPTSFSNFAFYYTIQHIDIVLGGNSRSLTKLQLLLQTLGSTTEKNARCAWMNFYETLKELFLKKDGRRLSRLISFSWEIMIYFLETHTAQLSIHPMCTDKILNSITGDTWNRNETSICFWNEWCSAWWRLHQQEKAYLSTFWSHMFW